MFHVLNITYTQPLDIVDQARPAHLKWLGDLVEQKRILLAGRLESQGGAVLIAADMSAEDADALTASDPYVAAGVASYERVSFNAGFRAAGI
ncbi:uncharacterized protein YciI [Mycobacterium sp. MAA66]|uniref:YciI family protein n=1 Tax=Mycobacterium sp. MAA66 TaxID=3156297 RepID=UPI0035131841